MNRINALVERWEATFLGRVWGRYGAARGSVLAGGIAYFAFFSIFPALAIGFTVLGLVVGNDSALQREIVDAVNRALGTTSRNPLVGLEQDDGALVSLDTLVQPRALTLSAVTGLVALLFTGLGWLGAIRQGVRAVFGRPGVGGQLRRVRDLGMLATFGVAVLASAVGSVLVTTASTAVLGWVGLDGTTGATLVVGALTTVVVLAVDAVIFVLLFRMLSDVHVPLRVLRRGAVAGAVGLGVLKLSGGLLLGRLSDNRFLATFAVIIGLLVWMNLIGRLTLLAASWSATDAADVGLLPAWVHGGPVPDAGDGTEDAGRTAIGPIGAALTGPRAAVAARALQAGQAARVPSYGVRAADRTTLAAGVVLGFAGAATLRVARGAVRAVVGAVRD